MAGSASFSKDNPASPYRWQHVKKHDAWVRHYEFAAVPGFSKTREHAVAVRREGGHWRADLSTMMGFEALTSTHYPTAEAAKDDADKIFKVFKLARSKGAEMDVQSLVGNDGKIRWHEVKLLGNIDPENFNRVTDRGPYHTPLLLTPYSTKDGRVAIQRSETGAGEEIWEPVVIWPSKAISSLKPQQFYYSIQEARRAIDAVYGPAKNRAGTSGQPKLRDLGDVIEGPRAKKLEVDTVTGPSEWASALVNGDTSGLDDEDEKAMNLWADNLAKDGWSVVDIATDEETGEGQEPRFTWSYRLYGGTAGGGDVVDYVVHRHR
jgi:hypothetical protein